MIGTDIAPAVYFSIGDAVAGLGFTLAVQQLLRPAYNFRLRARYLSVTGLFAMVFAAAAAIVAAAIVATLAPDSTFFFLKPIVWEVLGAGLFASAYGALVLAIIHPVRVRSWSTIRFVRSGAHLLASATERDHTDFADDMVRSLPTLIEAAKVAEEQHWPPPARSKASKKDILRGEYAASFLGIAADPHFCGSLVRRSPWAVSAALQELANKQIHARSAEQFVRELASQAILLDDSMVAREIGYGGFGTVPKLTDSLFGNSFIVSRYDPLAELRFFMSPTSHGLLARYNAAAKACLKASLAAGEYTHSRVAGSISTFYQNAFRAIVWDTEKSSNDGALYQVSRSSSVAWEAAASLMADADWADLYASAERHRFETIDHLADVIYDGLCAISNGFEGVSDRYWLYAIDVFHHVFPSIGAEPDGMNPFQQLIAIKLIAKLRDNMRGYYPAVCRVLLACIGPPLHVAAQPNRTAFNILKDAFYAELQASLPALADAKPEKLTGYMPSSVTYDRATNTLTHTFADGTTRATDLSVLTLEHVSLATADVGMPSQLSSSGRSHVDRPIPQ